MKDDSLDLLMTAALEYHAADAEVKRTADEYYRLRSETGPCDMEKFMDAARANDQACDTAVELGQVLKEAALVYGQAVAGK